MIPKIIHQVWIGPMEPPLAWIDTWRAAHPGWEHKLWTESDFDFPLSTLRQVLLSPTYAGKVDLLSYEILKRFGGIYLDADSVCIQPLDDDLLRKDFLVAYENEVARPGLVAHGVMGCRPNHPVVNRLVEIAGNLTHYHMSGDDFVVTGPGLITRVIEERGDIDVMPSHLFYPYHFTGEECTDELLQQSYAVQIWGSTNVDSDVIRMVRERYGHARRAYCGQRMERPLPVILDAFLMQNENYQFMAVEDGYFLMGEGNFRGHQLNESAALVWQLCNGTSTTRQISELLASEFPGATRSIHQNVYEVVCEFIRRGFVEASWVTDKSSDR